VNERAPHPSDQAAFYYPARPCDLGEAAGSKLARRRVRRRCPGCSSSRAFSGLTLRHTESALAPRRVVGHFAQSVANKSMRFLRLIGCRISPVPIAQTGSYQLLFLQFLDSDQRDYGAMDDRIFQRSLCRAARAFSDANDRTECRRMRCAHF